MSTSQLNVNFHPQSRHENLLVQEIKDETLIYDLTAHKAFCLNSIAAAVWSQCDGQNAPHQIVNLIKFEKKIDSNEELVLLSLYELHKNNLLVETPEVNTAINQVDRRGMIRRLAIGTAFALPVISSLVAPTAAQAASGSISGQCQAVCEVGETCSCGIIGNPCSGTGLPLNLINLNLNAGACVNAAAEVTVPLIPFGPLVGTVRVCVVTNVCVAV